MPGEEHCGSRGGGAATCNDAMRKVDEHERMKMKDADQNEDKKEGKNEDKKEGKNGDEGGGDNEEVEI